jgi:hypothetical protein
MSQEAGSDAIAGSFDTVLLSYQDFKCRLRRGDGRYWADLSADADASEASKEIVLCTGSHHMQAYWYATGQDGVLAQLPFVYLREAGRWIPRNAAFLRPPERRPTSEVGRWNQTCIKCHTTGARPGIVDATHMDAKVSELGIACEACHGPGQAHVVAHRTARDIGANAGRDPIEGDIVNPASLSSRQASEVCAQCHSVSQFATDAARDHWQVSGFKFRPGGDLAEEREVISGRNEQLRAHNVEFLRLVAAAFWSDGMVRVAGREFNGLLETPCFQRGSMSCMSCHTMHKADDDPRALADWADDQLNVNMRTNQACTQCHSEFAKSTALVAHTHHEVTSAGSECYNCHMPHTSYGLLKATRSHQLTSPNVASSIIAGRPNACNQCHLDKTLDWTARRLADWYGASAPPLTAAQRDYAASVLWALEGDAGVRALAAWNFGWTTAVQISDGDWFVPVLAELMNDPYDAVRYMAQRSLRSLPAYQDFEFDFLATPEERRQAIDLLLAKWADRTSKQPAPRIGQALLLDASGGVRREEFTRMLQRRDNRPITLVE